MTPEQKSALDKAFELLGEHYDQFVIITNAESDEFGEFTSSNYSFSGGKAIAIGLCEMAKAKMIHTHIHGDDKEEDKP